MNATQFVGLIEKVYGQYGNETQRGLVLEWAKLRGEDTLKAVYTFILKSHSLQYKSCPFIAELEQAYHATRDEVDIARENTNRIAGEKRLQIEHDEKIISAEYFTEFKAALGKGPKAMAELRQRYFGGV